MARVLSCAFCEISKKIFFTEHLWGTASDHELSHGTIYELIEIIVPWLSTTELWLFPELYIFVLKCEIDGKSVPKVK